MEDDTVDLMEHIMSAVDEAGKYGLAAEVLAFAFMDLCEDNARIKEAINHGFYEWIK